MLQYPSQPLTELTSCVETRRLVSFGFTVLQQFPLQLSFWHIDERTQQMVYLCHVTPLWRKDNIRTNIQSGINPEDLVVLLRRDGWRLYRCVQLFSAVCLFVGVKEVESPDAVTPLGSGAGFQRPSSESGRREEALLRGPVQTWC